MFLCFLVLLGLVPLVHCEASWLDGYSKRKLFYWQSSFAAQDHLTVVNQTGFDSNNIFYIYNETQADFEDLTVTQSDGFSLLYCWNQTTYNGLNCTFWVNFPAANTTYWLYWSNPSASSSWSRENTFNDVVEEVVAAWPLNELDGGDDVIDYSGYGNDGSPTGTSVTDSYFSGAKARQFAAGNFIDFGDAADLTPQVSLGIYIYPSTLAGGNTYQEFIQKGTGNINNYKLRLFSSAVNAAKLDIDYSDATDTRHLWRSTGDIVEAWQFLCVDFTGGSINVTLDGVNFPGSWLVGDGSTNPKTNNDDHVLAKTVLGQYLGVACNYFLGTQTFTGLNGYYGDATLEEGTILGRVWASSEITEYGATETALETVISNEEILGISIALIIAFFSVTIALVIVKRK